MNHPSSPTHIPQYPRPITAEEAYRYRVRAQEAAAEAHNALLDADHSATRAQATDAAIRARAAVQRARAATRLLWHGVLAWPRPANAPAHYEHAADARDDAEALARAAARAGQRHPKH